MGLTFFFFFFFLFERLTGHACVQSAVVADRGRMAEQDEQPVSAATVARPSPYSLPGAGSSDEKPLSPPITKKEPKEEDEEEEEKPKKRIGRPPGSTGVGESAAPLALGKQSDLVLYVLDAVEDRAIASQCRRVAAHARVVAPERLPRARYRRLDAAEATGGLTLRTYERPAHYDHELGGPAADDLWASVAYDMDSEDERWLQDYNSSHEKSKKDENSSGENSSTLTEDGFELIVDRLEKLAFRSDRRAESAARQLAAAQSDDVCAVCGDGASEDANQIIYCDGCDVAVHQQCYGVPYIPEGSWRCERCLARGPVRCCLCPAQGAAHALRCAATGEWVHVLCAVWAPHCALAFVQGPGEIEYLARIDVRGITPADRAPVCCLCRRPGGVCARCAHAGCPNAFHATCARAARLSMRCTVPEVVADSALLDSGRSRMAAAPPAPCSHAKYRAWCPDHRPIGRTPGRRKTLLSSLSSVELVDPVTPVDTPVTPVDPPVEEVANKTTTKEVISTEEKDEKKEMEKDDEKEKEQPKKRHGEKKRQMTLFECIKTAESQEQKQEQKPQEQQEQEQEQRQQEEKPTEEETQNQPYAGVKVSRVYAKTPGIAKEAVNAVHAYWVGKRRARGDVPLLRQFDPAVMMLTRPVVKHHPKHTNDRLGLRKLQRLRYDFERTRNVLEVVRQREALKLALVAQAEAHAALAARTPLQRRLDGALRALQQHDPHGLLSGRTQSSSTAASTNDASHPMDLALMGRKVAFAMYPDWEAFARDFALCCTNVASDGTHARAAPGLYRRGLAVLARRFGTAAVRTVLPTELEAVPDALTAAGALPPVHPHTLPLSLHSDSECDDEVDDADDARRPRRSLRPSSALLSGDGTTSLLSETADDVVDAAERKGNSKTKKKKKHKKKKKEDAAGVKRPRGRPRKNPPPEGGEKAETSPQPQPRKKPKTERIKPVHYVIYEDVDPVAEAAAAERRRELRRKAVGCLRELGVDPDEVDTAAPRAMRSRDAPQPAALPARRRVPPRRLAEDDD